MSVWILFKHEKYLFGTVADIVQAFSTEEAANKEADRLNRELGSSFIQFYVEEHEVV